MRKGELFEAIRRDHALPGWGRRRLAREHQVGRRTVRQALKSAVPPERKAPLRLAPVLFPGQAVHRRDHGDGPKDAVQAASHGAPNLAADCCRAGGRDCGIDVRRYVGKRKREMGRGVEVMVPQVKTPGAEAEVDFFKATVIMAGIELVLWCFQMRACYSGRVFVRAVARATQQAFLESMVLGLEHFGDSFGLVRMDNHKLAVIKVLRARTREEHDRFIALRSHYLFETKYCLVGEQGAHENGGVKAAWGTSVVTIWCRDLIELNEQLLRCGVRANPISRFARIRSPISRESDQLSGRLKAAA